MQSEDNDGVETGPASLDDLASERSQAFKRTLRLIFLFGALLSLYSVLGPYPLLVAGPVLLSVAAVCICAGVVLLGAPKDAPVIGKDVAVAVFPWLLACGILANGALDHSSEVLYQPVVLRTRVPAQVGRRGCAIMASGTGHGVAIHQETISLRSRRLLFPARPDHHCRHKARRSQHALDHACVALRRGVAQVYDRQRARHAAIVSSSRLDFRFAAVSSIRV